VLQVRIFIAFLLLLAAIPTNAEEINPHDLPDKPTIVRKDGRLFTPGFYPRPIVSFNVGCKPLETEEDAKLIRSYRNSQYLHLNKAWDSSSQYKDNAPVFHLITDRQGRLSEITLLHSSGNAVMDEAALNNIKNLLPLEPVPSAYTGATVWFLLSVGKTKFVTTYPDQKDQDRVLATYAAKNAAMVRDINKLIRQYWRPPGNLKDNKRTRMLMVFHTKTGKLLLRKVETTSCDQAYDQSVLDAIDRIKDTLSLPHAVGFGDILAVLLTFDIIPYKSQ
jgi:hypothetical protein